MREIMRDKHHQLPPKTKVKKQIRVPAETNTSNLISTKLSLSMACPKNLKINPNVHLKEVIDAKSGQHFFKILIPRDLVKDVLGGIKKKEKPKQRPVPVVAPSSIDSSDAGEDDSMRLQRHS